MAVEIEYVEHWSQGNMEEFSHLVLSGQILPGDSDVFRSHLARYPDVRFVKIGQSPGGSLYDGIKIAELIRNAGLHVQVLGPAASAASIISLGGRESVSFYEGDGFVQSEVLFHCAYLRGEAQCHAEATQDMARVLSILTTISQPEWYSWLMTETSPSEVVPIKLSELFSHWDCWTSGRTGTHCSER
jgi:hypothetical protein